MLINLLVIQTEGWLGNNVTPVIHNSLTQVSTDDCTEIILRSYWPINLKTSGVSTYPNTNSELHYGMDLCEVIQDQVLFSGRSVLFEYLYSTCLKGLQSHSESEEWWRKQWKFSKGEWGSFREKERVCSDRQRAYEQKLGLCLYCHVSLGFKVTLSGFLIAYILTFTLALLAVRQSLGLTMNTAAYTLCKSLMILRSREDSKFMWRVYVDRPERGWLLRDEVR